MRSASTRPGPPPRSSSSRPWPAAEQQRRIRGGDVLLLDESYNASAVSVRAALDVLRLMPGRRHIAVLGDMLELGALCRSRACRVGAGGDAVGRSALCVRPAHPVAVRPGAASASRRHAADAEALAPVVAAAVRPGDAVLVKGSLGSRMRAVVRALEDAGTSARRPCLVLFNIARGFAEQYALVEPVPLHHLPLGRRLPDRIVPQLRARPGGDPLAALGAARRAADPARRAGAAHPGKEGHADHGRRADPGVADRSRPCYGPTCATATCGRCCC